MSDNKKNNGQSDTQKPQIRPQQQKPKNKAENESISLPPANNTETFSKGNKSKIN